ncbi:Crp/Fnr family transcriptional regulator [Ferdinandcohnia quinoae]|uniref:Crp/Fnr family transcriptional regulator n=1 Tax=Fredinandcohnia quinoae TaxID=2918902 RepID=UPI001F07019E|nr:Crp/Fnr family transcriptional regulator [Fredinandcohnia sp. SECRCQ15]
MNEEEFVFLEKVTHATFFQKGEIIFREGENADTFFIPESGLIKLSNVSSNGKEQIIRLLFPGDIFGQSSLLKDGKYYTNAMALENSIICTINKNDFTKAMRTNPELSSKIITTLFERLQVTDELVRSLSLLEVEQRLARAILLFSEKIQPVHKCFQLPIQKKELASLLGTTPETLSRKIKLLTEENLIKFDDNKNLHILNYRKLKLLAES